MNRSPVRQAPRCAVAALVVFLLAAVPAAAADCTAAVAGNDTAGWNSGRRTFLGKALGQTFYAPDTLISRITVWRSPDNLNYGGDRLFVTTVDTVDYAPPRPITQNILRSGPTVFVVNSDPPGLPIRMDFMLDPPLSLPHPGLYAFFVQREGCDAGETSIIATEPGRYGAGNYWRTGQTSFLPCYLPSADYWEDLDLCFEMEFCRYASTPVRGASWGRLKVIYR